MPAQVAGDSKFGIESAQVVAVLPVKRGKEAGDNYLAVGLKRERINVRVAASGPWIEAGV